MDPAQSTYARNERLEVLALMPTDVQSVLDIGCASGGFGMAVRRALGPRARIVGVESVPSQAKAARSSGAYDEVVDGYYPDALLGRGDVFDLVVFNDVLEHTLDPWSLLAGAKEVIGPGGRVLASLPNIQHFSVIQRVIRGRWDYADEGILDRTHLRFFTRKTMLEMFDNAGFDVQLIRGINARLDDRGRLGRLVPFAGDFKWQQFVIVARPRS